jgi:hypothetical protein
VCRPFALKENIMRPNHSLVGRIVSLLGKKSRKKGNSASARARRSLQIEPLEVRQLLTVALPQSGPIPQPIPIVNISQGTTARVVPLFNAFTEAGGPLSSLQYQVLADSNPSLFAATPSVAAPAQLQLSFPADAVGCAALTLSATDANGLSATATLVVDVSAGDASLSPGTSGKDTNSTHSNTSQGSGATINRVAGTRSFKPALLARLSRVSRCF